MFASWLDVELTVSTRLSRSSKLVDPSRRASVELSSVDVYAVTSRAASDFCATFRFARASVSCLRFSLQVALDPLQADVREVVLLDCRAEAAVDLIDLTEHLLRLRLLRRDAAGVGIRCGRRAKGGNADNERLRLSSPAHELPAG